MRIIVVEPHPDDAFLSLGWHLEKEWAEYDRTIVTVYADDKRGREAEDYAAAVGANSVVLGLPESKMLGGGRISAVPALKSTLDGLNATSADRVIFPLGLQHPDHLRVAATRPVGALRYLDSPYWSKQKLGDRMRGKTEGMRVNSILFPHARKWRHIGLFKTQAKFFHFNAHLKTALLPEVILCPSM